MNEDREQELQRHLNSELGLNNLMWVSVLEALRESYGNGVLDVIHQTNSRILEAHWRDKARILGLGGVESLVEAHWGESRKFGFEFSIEETETGKRVHCSKCP